ncbi:MAG TPA: C4-type zinc ribbon domain-containing protein [Dehalococcoidales bacterium]|nr:C4-type zinc ribbon domain-containing protein [Dehalococcoidales bacterium]
MSIAKQLYQLQELDVELEAKERTLKQIVGQLGENQAVVRVRHKLEAACQHLEELKRQQRFLEGEVDDIVTKLITAENKLYGGGIGNPKELTNLQHEVDALKDRRNQLEDKLLEAMEQVERATAGVATVSNELKTVETDWQNQQQRLSAEMEQLKTILSDLEHKRQLQSAEIDPKAVEFYHELRKQKGEAVARVEQGVCQGCRISLTTTELQRVRGGNLIKCNSCGRILFLA